MTFGSRTKSWRLHCGLVVTAIFCSAAAQAQSPAVVITPAKAAAPLSLQQVFEAAWARQPEALTLPSRRDAARAKQSTAQAWTPEPAALEIGYKTDRLNRNQGASEIEVGVSVPLWLPRERAQSAALSDAEAVALESRTMAAKLRIAATVRDAWWQCSAHASKPTSRATSSKTPSKLLPTWNGAPGRAIWHAQTSIRRRELSPARKPILRRLKPVSRQPGSNCRRLQVPHQLQAMLMGVVWSKTPAPPRLRLKRMPQSKS